VDPLSANEEEKLQSLPVFRGELFPAFQLTSFSWRALSSFPVYQFFVASSFWLSS
jgi:hypothetical protein